VQEFDEGLEPAAAPVLFDRYVAGHERVRVRVRPAEGRLQGFVQGVEAAAGGTLEHAGDSGGAEGVEGGFYCCASRFERGVFRSGGLAGFFVALSPSICPFKEETTPMTRIWRVGK